MLGGAAGVGAVALTGPFAAVVGPAVAFGAKKLGHLGLRRLFQQSLNELAERQLTETERDRWIRALRRAAEALDARLLSREGIRDDGFFTEPQEETGRTAAAELIEGVLQKAQNTFEQRKAERLGEFFAFVAFTPDISAPHANYLLEVAGRLTYHQLLYLGILGAEDRSWLPDWDPSGMFTRLEINIVAALEGLAREGLIVRDDNRLISSFADINPRRLRTVLNGKLLYEAMNLHEAEKVDIEELARGLELLGKIDVDKRRTRVEGVVPPGSPPDQKRVKLDKQVVQMPKPPVVRLIESEGEPERETDKPPERL